MSPNKQVITISNNLNQSNLLVTATDAEFSLSLESTSDEAPPSPNFLISKNDKAYECFEEFCKKICTFQSNAVLLDELVSTEHAPIVIFQKQKEGILIRFCIEKGFKMKVRHLRGKGNVNLTNSYAELFTSLAYIKINAKNIPATALCLNC